MQNNIEKIKKPKKKKKKAFIILACIVGGLAALIGIYAYDNLHYDEGPLKATLQAGFTEKQKTLDNGTLINYAEGPDNGPALLLLNGQAMAWEDYCGVLPQLSKYYHVYAADCHGHGKSSHDPARYTCKAMGEDFTTFIKTVIGKPCVVSGLSSGGIISTWIAANNPELVRGLIIEDSPFFSVEPSEMQNTWVWRDFSLAHQYLVDKPNVSYSVYSFQHSYFWNMFGGLQKIVAGSAEKYQAEHPGEPVKLWYVPHMMTYGMLYLNWYDLKFAETFYTGSWFNGTDQTKILSGVQCPAVYIKAKTKYGSDGVQWAANSDEDAARVSSLLKNSKMITIESGHDVHDEKPNEFIKIFTDFLQSIK